jgi:thiamine-phosphate pyrophosphorylase
MSVRRRLDVSSYLVVGPENTKARPVVDIVGPALAAGFTCIQLRSKVASAREMIALAQQVSTLIAGSDAFKEVTLLVDDRLDVVLAARGQGIKVDGVHVGQSDIPVEICRSYLGQDSIVGLSAPTMELFEQIGSIDPGLVDYLGVGPLHETSTKPDCGLTPDGSMITQGLSDLARLATISPIPVVVGGGVKEADIPHLARTGVDGFFVVSAVSEADDPAQAARALVETWKSSRAGSVRQTAV